MKRRITREEWLKMHHSSAEMYYGPVWMDSWVKYVWSIIAVISFSVFVIGALYNVLWIMGIGGFLSMFFGAGTLVAWLNEIDLRI